jgi:hypothetical protein
VATVTTNFNFPIPQSTDLVKDGATAIAALGTSVDTQFVDLKGGTTGQVLAKASNTDLDYSWVTTDDANAIQNAIVDAKGDLIAASAADTPARLAVGNNGETLVADSSTSTGLRYTSNFAAGKNVIINGNCQVAQRGSTLTATGTAWFYGAVDRFLGYSSAGNTATISQQAFTAGTAPVAGYESQFFVRSASTNTGTYLGYRIEDVRTFAGQTVTVSFWAKTNTAQTLSYFNIEQNFGSGGSASVGTNITPLPALTTSWQRFTGTITLPSVSGKTIGTGSYLFLVLQGDVNKNLDLWGLQVEAGSVATAFQTATGTIQGELAACQRYYYRITGATTAGTVLTGFGTASSATNAFIPIALPVTMRTVSPSTVDFATVRMVDWINATTNVTSMTIYDSNSNWVLLNPVTASGLTQYRPYSISAQSATTGYIGISAEL